MCTSRPQLIHHRSRRTRRGQALVEFAVIALIVYMLLAAILTFGHMLFVAQGTQQAVDVAGREISRTPLPADSHTLEEILRGNANEDDALRDVRQRVFDDHYLVLNVDSFHGQRRLLHACGTLVDACQICSRAIDEIIESILP